jgi:hypothetical protein
LTVPLKAIALSLPEKFPHYLFDFVVFWDLSFWDLLFWDLCSFGNLLFGFFNHLSQPLYAILYLP